MARRRRERVVLPLEEGPDMPRRRGGSILVWFGVQLCEF
jgi:hypothetical protein